MVRKQFYISYQKYQNTGLHNRIRAACGCTACAMRHAICALPAFLRQRPLESAELYPMPRLLQNIVQPAAFGCCFISF